MKPYNDVTIKMKLLFKQVPDESDLIYNHAVRVVLDFLKERKDIFDFNTPDQVIALIVDRFLIIEPEADSEFKFNAGINDCIDIIRRLK